MSPSAIEKAKRRLNLAITHVSELPKSKGYSEYCDHWYQFLVAFNNVLTMLKKGAKDNPSSRQWFGQKEAERRKDQLVQYLFQARDDDEHGIGSVLTFTPPRAFFTGRNSGASSISFTVNDGNMKGKLKIKSTDGENVVVRVMPSVTSLSKVVGRGPVEYAPPKIHNGKILQDTSPLAIASLGIIYLEQLIVEAEGMV